MTSTEFHKNIPIGSKVIKGDTQTDRQTGDLISLTFLFKEGRLKIFTFVVQWYSIHWNTAEPIR
jgi:hypothetical protein